MEELMGQPEKVSQEAESVLGALKSAVEGAVKGDHTVLKKELDHIIDAAKHIKVNWKKALPAIAAVGAGAYLLSLRNAKKAKSSGAKKVKAKVKAVVGKAKSKTTKKKK